MVVIVGLLVGGGSRVGERLVGDFFSRWFAAAPAIRDLFPAGLADQRYAFAQALGWVYAELAAQRAQEPVAFLAQLGRDHRKHGVTQQHYSVATRISALALSLPPSCTREMTVCRPKACFIT